MVRFESTLSAWSLSGSQLRGGAPGEEQQQALLYLSSRFWPTHTRPPWRGVGLLQERWRTWKPMPQLVLQGDQEVQGVQAPFLQTEMLLSGHSRRSQMRRKPSEKVTQSKPSWGRCRKDGMLCFSGQYESQLTELLLIISVTDEGPKDPSMLWHPACLIINNGK